LAVTFGSQFTVGALLVGARAGVGKRRPYKTGDLGSDLDLEALLHEQAGEIPDDVVVVGGDDFGQEFDDGHVGAEARPDGAEFEADGAAADHHELLRHGREGDRLVAGDNGLAVKLHERQLHRRGAGGDDDVLGGEAPRAVGGNGPYLDLGRGDEFCLAGDDGDLAGLGEEREAAGVPGDDLVLALEQRGQVDLDRTELDAVGGRMRLGEGEVLGRMEEGLARMQPTLRQVPPSVARLSMRATFRPSCAARNAHT